MKQQIKLLHVEEVLIPSEIKKNTSYKITIRGRLNDPAWKVEEPKINLNSNSRELTIRIAIKRNPRHVAPQVITPIQIEHEIIFPANGEWRVKCNNYSIKIDVTE